MKGTVFCSFYPISVELILISILKEEVIIVYVLYLKDFSFFNACEYLHQAIPLNHMFVSCMSFTMVIGDFR
jgi:hypothetical protein